MCRDRKDLIKTKHPTEVHISLSNLTASMRCTEKVKGEVAAD